MPRVLRLGVVLAAGLLGLAANAAGPAPDAVTDAEGATALHGRWDGLDRASEALYGTLRISRGRIAWRGLSRAYPPCQTGWRLLSRQDTLDTYPDNLLPPEPGRRYTVYRLQLVPRGCVGAETVWQFALPHDRPGEADLVTYRDDGNLSGWHRLGRQPAASGRR